MPVYRSTTSNPGSANRANVPKLSPMSAVQAIKHLLGLITRQCVAWFFRPRVRVIPFTGPDSLKCQPGERRMVMNNRVIIVPCQK